MDYYLYRKQSNLDWFQLVMKVIYEVMVAYLRTDSKIIKKRKGLFSWLTRRLREFDWFVSLDSSTAQYEPWGENNRDEEEKKEFRITLPGSLVLLWSLLKHLFNDKLCRIEFFKQNHFYLSNPNKTKINIKPSTLVVLYENKDMNRQSIDRFHSMSFVAN